MKIIVEYEMPDDREEFELTQKSFQMLNTLMEIRKQLKWVDDVDLTEEVLKQFIENVRGALAEPGDVW